MSKDGWDIDMSSFGSVMESLYPSYMWEELDVTTDDGYILKMHHLWNEDKRDASKGPIMWMHGAGGASTDLAFAGNSDWSPAPAVQIQMADLGHDVYLTNNRGN